LMDPSVRPAGDQYGWPDATVYTPNGHFDPAATLAVLQSQQRVNSLQGQLLASGVCDVGMCAQGRTGAACMTDSDCALESQAFVISAVDQAANEILDAILAAAAGGEECDDGNQVDGDGCDTNCTLTRCGNGIVTAGEECDDGNLRRGDGCSPTCTLICPATPSSTCYPPIESRRSRLMLNHPKKAGKDRLDWKWRGVPSAKAEFGSPTLTDDYTLCVYDSSRLVLSAVAPAGNDCNPGLPCWKENKSGFRYKSRNGVPDGLTSISLRGGKPDGRASIRVRGRGPTLTLPNLLTLSSPLTAEIRKSSGGCWSAVYSAPHRRHDAEHFDDLADQPE